MSSSTPVVEYASMSSGDMFMQAVAEIADEKVRQLAAQTGLSVGHVRQLKRENRLHELSALWSGHGGQPVPGPHRPLGIATLPNQ